MAPQELTVAEASAAYESAMRNVLPGGDGVCRICGTWIADGYFECYPCANQPNQLDAVVPITYSEHLGQVHTALRNYKDGIDSAQAFAAPRLAAILWRFIEIHEPCIARSAGVTAFDLVTTVPSSTPDSDEARPNLRWIVQACAPLEPRFERVLVATGQVSGRKYSPDRYTSNADLDGRQALLIDDTWTTGGHAQSAASALRDAGATHVGLVTIGRHVRPEWEIIEGTTSGEMLAKLPKQFDWQSCRVHPSTF